MVEFGIDRFVFNGEQSPSPGNPVPDLLEEIEFADRHGIDAFGIGEHHTGEFADSSPAVLLSAAAARTSRIRLSSAITLLGAADPVRVFEDFATLDLVSAGRAEIVAGRGAYAEAFGLFGHDMADYADLYAEKLDLLLKLRTGEPVHWRGRHRARLDGQIVYPRPIQTPLPVWAGATGSLESFVRAGTLGLPLALATTGGDIVRLPPLVEAYREAGRRAGHAEEVLKVAFHAIGYIADESAQARHEFFEPYAGVFGPLWRRVGRPEIQRDQFDAITGPDAAIFVGSPDEVSDKILAIDRLFGGVARLCLQMTVGRLPREQRLRTIELLAIEVAPRVRAGAAVA
jgi:alkanesulfonate monooxygenase SsuD/methylene tetrahydromethanopterin reductase-like flavin-dependent oxidoreductase (luciferase family)